MKVTEDVTENTTTRLRHTTKELETVPCHDGGTAGLGVKMALTAVCVEVSAAAESIPNEFQQSIEAISQTVAAPLLI